MTKKTVGFVVVHALVSLVLAGAPDDGSTRREGARSEPAIFDAAHRVPVSLVFHAPSKALAGDTHRNRVAKLVEGALAIHTDLRVVLVDDQTVQDCASQPRPANKGRMTCLVEVARPDYQPFDREGRLKDWPAVVAVRRDAVSVATSRFMIVVAATQAANDANRVALFLVDTEHALEFGVHAARASGAYSPRRMDELESYIVESSVRAQSEASVVSSDDELEATIHGFFRSDARVIDALSRARHWWGFGSMEFATDVEGANIVVDDRPVGITRAGLHRLVRLKPGLRRVTLDHPTFYPASAEVEIEPDQVARLDLSMIRRPNRVALATRTAAIWGGIGLAAAGALLAVSQVPDGSPFGVVCFHGASADRSCGGGPEWRRMGRPEAPTLTQSPNGRGLALAPVGIGLAAGGAVMAAGAGFFGDDASLPWVQVLAGVSSGVAVYLVALLAGGQNAVATAGHPSAGR